MLPNAFIGTRRPPSDSELAAVLGPAHALWQQLLMALAEDTKTHGWSSYSPKAGWSLTLKHGDRTILYLSPCRGGFRASFALGGKAVAAALAARISARVRKIIREAKRYAEGTAIRVEVNTARDLPDIEALARIKLKY